MAGSDVRINRVALESFLRPFATREVRKRAARVEAAQVALCPVRTGHLRSTIGTTLVPTPDGLAADVGASADYAIWVEVGTSDTPRQSFIRPSLIAAAG